MIEIQNIRKKFKQLQVLNGVSISLSPGSVTALVGPNGSGKTTLMKSIVGLVRPDSGTIHLDGELVSANPDVRNKMGYMSQVARYPENLSPLELIAMVRGIRKQQTEIAEELFSEFQLHEHLKKPMRSLSGGTRQKVGAVLAFMYEPRVLLLDEPTAGLDPLVTQRLKNRIRHVADNGSSVLITSHVIAEIEELATRIVYINEGVIMYDGSVQNLLSSTGHSNLPAAIAAIMEKGGGVQ
ncbi:MAG: ABC transporter ATP-binding protein [Chlorobi bacterium]|nr:MAG: ABC transporter ATP-binding protein [Bacteroidota bacterium]MBE2265912.1 ABC transporter ATP-binding protein [Flavobacteriales bacterium]MBL1160927.1 ABC transporter ATP-binding protein [Chlorobiota bacterium]MBW7852888.1 ABC transporter ATP-binding protein [Candidatus Kapabacteria bacterium]MCC6330881.1 ABC transporter ATP-binding protein [Ignavibacteria bacterium]